MVKAYCRDLGIPYAETGLIDSYRQALRHMHEVGNRCVPTSDDPPSPPASCVSPDAAPPHLSWGP